MDDDKEIEGQGHLENDEAPTPEQAKDPKGINGPSYEVNQVSRGRETNPGGSTDSLNTLSHVDEPEAS